jgi:hypothetical protein
MIKAEKRIKRRRKKMIAQMLELRGKKSSKKLSRVRQ